MLEVGGAICRDNRCGWESNNLKLTRCPRCGNWCRYWAAEVENDTQAKRARMWFDGCWYMSPWRSTDESRWP